MQMARTLLFSPQIVRFLMKNVCVLAVGLMLSAVPAFAQGAAGKGAAVYAAQKCAMCHSIAGKGQAKGPLDGVGTKLTADDIREWIVNPAAAAKKHNATRKPPMRAYASLPKEDLDALVAYMASLKK
jgi:mono/diheme cytochrome c family protein